MKWQCALLKRWLPEYPDGDLPAWGKRWLKSHVPGCPACRQEVAELKGVIAALEAAPVADPAPEFWGEFSRELHLKLVQAAQDGQAAPGATSSSLTLLARASTSLPRCSSISVACAPSATIFLPSLSIPLIM